MRLFILFFLLIASIEAVSDYYKILELSKDASDRDIKSAYRRLSKMYHPDKNSSPEAHEKFIEIGEAYEVLSDPEKKSNYDTHGDPNGQPNMQFGDIFNQFFGGGGFGGQANRGVRKGDNTQASLLVALGDFYTGKEIEFDLEMLNICDTCEGSGSKDKQKHTCNKCNGRGIIQMKRQLAPGMYQTFNAHCDECGGKGQKITNKCSACGGQGVKPTSRHYSIYVSPGFPRDGNQLLEGEGDQNPDWVPGDLIINIKEDFKRSGGYRRIGNNLYRTEVLSFKESIYGNWKRDVPYFDSYENNITLERAKGVVTMDGEVEVVKGKGMPVFHEDDHHGDLFIEYRVIFPGGANLADLRDEL